jgi:hypothetical protein
LEDDTIMPGIFEPLWKGPQRLADDLAGAIDPQYGEGGTMKGLAAGMLQGVGNVASDMTSPFSLATSAIPVMSRLGLIGKAAGGLRNAQTATQEALAAERAMKPAIGGNAIWEETANAARRGDEAVEAGMAGKRVSQVPRPSGTNTAPKVAKEGFDHSMLSQGEIGHDVYKIDWPGNPLHGARVTAEGLKRLGMDIPQAAESAQMIDPGIGPTRVSAFMERLGKMDAARRRSQRLQPGRFNPDY